MSYWEKQTRTRFAPQNTQACRSIRVKTDQNINPTGLKKDIFSAVSLIEMPLVTFLADSQLKLTALCSHW